MRRALTWVVAVAAAAGMLLAAPVVAGGATAAPAAPYCGIYWGSLAKSGSASGQGQGVGPLSNVRAGRHDCYDRLVLDIAGGAPGYRVQYVDQVTEDAKGNPVPLRGNADLQIVVLVPLFDDAGGFGFVPPNRIEVVDVSGWQTFRQVADAGHFEGQITMGLGVRGRLPFRVFTLAGPGSNSRLVIDVAHRW